eukprot:482942_1
MIIYRLLLLIALSTVVSGVRSGVRSRFRCAIECIPGFSCVMSHDQPTQKTQRTLSQTEPDRPPNATSKPQHRQDRLCTPNVESRPHHLPQSRNLVEGMDATTLAESSESGETHAQSGTLASMSALSWRQTSYSYTDQTLHSTSLSMSKSKQRRTAWGSSIDMTRSNRSQNDTPNLSFRIRNLTNPGNPLQPPTKRNGTVEEISGERINELITNHCRTIVAVLPGNMPEEHERMMRYQCVQRYRELLNTLDETVVVPLNQTVIALDLVTIVSRHAVVTEVHNDDDLTQILNDVRLVNTEHNDFRHSIVQHPKEDSTYTLHRYRSHFMDFMVNAQAGNSVLGIYVTANYGSFANPHAIHSAIAALNHIIALELQYNYITKPASPFTFAFVSLPRPDRGPAFGHPIEQVLSKIRVDNHFSERKYLMTLIIVDSGGGSSMIWHDIRNKLAIDAPFEMYFAPMIAKPRPKDIFSGVVRRMDWGQFKNNIKSDLNIFYCVDDDFWLRMAHNIMQPVQVKAFTGAGIVSWIPWSDSRPFIVAYDCQRIGYI